MGVTNPVPLALFVANPALASLIGQGKLKGSLNFYQQGCFLLTKWK
ncbi:hypothetical protein [Desulfotruncus arcticus]|nr:hypothetical protein [Desulfotruncus arcticus]